MHSLSLCRAFCVYLLHARARHSCNGSCERDGQKGQRLLLQARAPVWLEMHTSQPLNRTILPYMACCGDEGSEIVCHNIPMKSWARSSEHSTLRRVQTPREERPFVSCCMLHPRSSYAVALPLTRKVVTKVTVTSIPVQRHSLTGVAAHK